MAEPVFLMLTSLAAVTPDDAAAMPIGAAVTRADGAAKGFLDD
jgi:hypothetical protein